MVAELRIEIADEVLKSAPTLQERVKHLLKLRPVGTNRFAIHNQNGLSGYNYWVNGELIAELRMATLFSGYFVFKRTVNLGQESSETYEYYNSDGSFSYIADSLTESPISYNSINMEPGDAFVNYLYNALNVQYEAAEKGLCETKRIILIESILKGLYKDISSPLGVSMKPKDPALLNIKREIRKVELDPILNWDERQKVYEGLKKVRKKILKTKCRAHRLSYIKFALSSILDDVKTKTQLFYLRPVDNILGLIKLNTWGRVIWFTDTVKANLGLSIAMAIYGPFTFYFITQPMNPHAMWAVGKVRSAYLDAVGTFDEKQIPILEKTTEKVLEKLKSNTPDIWEDRMSKFKAMQIAYEESMVFAARMGRLEQMENQFLFPLTAEAAWQELERYLSDVKSTLKFNTNLKNEYVSFLKSEIARIRNLKVYIWKKLNRFFKDHPYIVADKNSEQTGKDIYTSRSFAFFKLISEHLQKQGLVDEQIPSKFIKNAENYVSKRKQSNSVLQNLKSNSFIFKDSELPNTDYVRSKLMRHWEILFLQQNKKQEAASFGLQTYTWSVRNTLWVLQSIYSAKRRDLSTLTYKFNLNNTDTIRVQKDRELDLLLENLTQMLTLEYLSIKKEIESSLGQDKEADERMKVIIGIKDYLEQRDSLFNNHSNTVVTEL